MESFSQALAPYKEPISTVATVATIVQFLSGLLVVKKIHDTGGTVNVRATPFLGGIVLY